MDQAHVQSIDVARSLETTLDTLAHLLRPGIDVKRYYGPVPVVVSAVGTELSQVWTNLIENAIDAMRGRGELRFQIYREDDCALIEIGNTGCGIPPEIKHHIVDPFFTTKGVGEGLGLKTVQTIVRKLGGNIQASHSPVTPLEVERRVAAAGSASRSRPRWMIRSFQAFLTARRKGSCIEGVWVSPSYEGIDQYFCPID